MLSAASIHKLVVEHCHKNNLKAPSYRSVCRIIYNVPDDLAPLGREGSKAYRQQYDLLHIRAAEQPNELWQADHVLIDIEVLNDKNKPQKPWLTVVIDDCSRAICGYELSFLSPSAQKTSLCFRHAIWRKPDPDWGILGVPEALYTDHGSDFTSKHIEQVCIDLKIKLIFSQVGQPRGRGKIERFFRTLNQMLISTLQAVTQNGTQRKHIDLKLLDTLIYEFIIKYNHTIHPEIGITPVSRILAYATDQLVLAKQSQIEIPMHVREENRNFAELVIIDEAERLKPQAFELIRELYDKGGTTFIFIGMPGIDKIIERYPQLYSRVGFVHQFKNLGKNEVEFLINKHFSKLGVNIDQADFGDQEAVSTIIRMTNGNFRLINRLLKQSYRIMQVNCMASLTTEIIEAARKCLLIGEC